MHVPGHQQVNVARRRRHPAWVDEDAPPIWAGEGAGATRAAAQPARNGLLHPGGMQRLPAAVRKARQPGGEGAVGGVVAEAIAMHDPQAHVAEREIEAMPVHAAASGGFQAAARHRFAIALYEIEAPSRTRQISQTAENAGVARQGAVGLQPVLEEVAQDHQAGGRHPGQAVEEGGEGSRPVVAEMDIAQDIDGRWHSGDGSGGWPPASPHYRAPPMSASPEASSVSVLRLRPEWDDADGRALAASLPALAAGAGPEAVVYRARNTLVRGELRGRMAVVKCFPARPRWKRPLASVSKAVKAYDHAIGLLARGIATPEPFCAVQAADGRAWFACAWEAGCHSVWELHRDELPGADRHCEELGAFIGRLHEAGCDHRDLTPGNVLLRPSGAGFDHLLVDCNRLRFAPVTARLGLARLVSLECAGRTLPGYCRERGIPLSWARRFYGAVADWHRLKWWIKDGTRPWRRRLGF